MIISIDIGNTHIFGGIFNEDKIQCYFRYPSRGPVTSDTFGLFLLSFLKHHHIESTDIHAIVQCSVVPGLEYSVVSACKKYFNLTPLELKPGVKTGLKLAIKNPLELGADRVANAVAAINHVPNKNLIIVDFGTATTICAVTKNKVYLGGAILPGIKLSMDSLSEKAAKLSNVEIAYPESPLGKTTLSQLQVGVVLGQLGAVKEVIQRIQKTILEKEELMIIATGGYTALFESESLFDLQIPDLVLQGLRVIWEQNQS